MLSTTPEKKKTKKILVLKESQRHPFHIVRPSYWPLFTSITLVLIALSIVWWFQKGTILWLFISLFLFGYCLVGWFTDITIEATYERAWTKRVARGIRIGFALFLVSEAMFFFSFFWAFLHTSLSPPVSIGCVWPPLGIEVIDYLTLPLVNTALLLFSGLTVTISHRGIKRNAMHLFKELLDMTAAIGLWFTIVQMLEYINAKFTIQDSIYGSLFYVMTGFHGLHVIIGTLFLFVCSRRAEMNHFTAEEHVGFELAAWYWHFVDIIWILLYLIVYWWGS